MTNAPSAQAMAGSEILSGQGLRGKILAKRGVCHDGVKRTLTGYIAQGVLYPMQVLDPSPQPVQAHGMANRLSHLRKKAGLTQDKLAAELNSGRSTVTKLERGEIPMNDRWLEKLSAILNCTPSDILGDMVPIVGKIGAGGSVVFEDLGSAEMVKRPPDTNGELIGLEVDGESMLPKFDPGDIVYISRDRVGVDLSDIGAICACRLLSGETYLKQLAKGSKPGVFTLRSYNAADMEDCELEWATPIRAMTPRHARRFH